MTPTAFTDPADFRAWLEKHHATAGELLIRCYKSHAREKGMTYRQALDEALCYGWIDGVRRRYDDDSFVQRFTPRRAKSVWSLVNVKRYRELEAVRRVRPPGRAAFRAHDPNKPRKYSFESKPVALSGGYAKKLRANPRAWAFFQGRPPWYRRVSSFWVMSAKRPETRERRLDNLIACSARGVTIPPLTRAPDRPASRRRRARR